MSWHSYRCKLRPALRAALLAVALTPSLVANTDAAPAPTDESGRPSVVFAVDPILGQAYVAHSPSDESSPRPLSIFNLSTKREIGSIPFGVSPSAIGVNPQTGLVYLANKAQDTVTVVHGPTHRIVSNARIAGGPQVLLVEPAAGRLYVGLGQEKAVRILDMATLTTVGSIDLGLEPLGLGFDRVRNRLLVTANGQDGGSSVVVSVDSDRQGPDLQLTLPNRPESLAVLDGIGRAYIPLASSGEVLVIDLDRLAVVQRLDNFNMSVRDVAVNERRSRVYLATGDSDVIIAVDPLTGVVLGSVETAAAADAIAVDSATARIFSTSANTHGVDVLADPASDPYIAGDLRITFQVTGGLAGLNDTLTIEPNGSAQLKRRTGGTSSLDLGGNRFQELASLFYECDFFALQHQYTALRPVPDALSFTVTAKDQQHEQTVVMSSFGTPPPALVDIVRRLERIRQEMVAPTAQLAAAG